MKVFMGHFLPRDGYGYAAIKIAQALQDAGADIYPFEMRAGEKFNPAGSESWHTPHPALLMGVPDWLPCIEAPSLAIHTMFEADRLPAGWPDLINRHAGLVVVPCSWCKEVFENNGVNKPIYVAKWGIDPADYFPLPRNPGGRPYTFLWSGNPDRRKGWDVAYGAFYRAFGSKNNNVKLLLHFRYPSPFGFRDPNVQVITGLLDRPELRKLLQDADCYLFPSRGEGWGMPPREAAATGLPVIATNYGGLSEEIEYWGIPLSIKGFSDADYGFWGPKGSIGKWAEPDIEEMAELMRWCYENQDEAARWGTGAADWLAQNATWERTARDFQSILQRLV